MVKILVVDNGGQWTHREWRVLRDLGAETEIITNTTPVEKINADGIVLSGGAARVAWESKKLGNVGDYLSGLKIPILGICVGHQFMAIHHGGEAGPSKVPEFGKAEVMIVRDSPLFNGVPKKFVAWESHNDEVTKIPKGFQVIASSRDCSVQAMQHRSRPLFGVQFHPEVENTEHGEMIFRNFMGLCSR